ncbi:hypothetical protein [Dysgonomonas macrotermitis]|nr:hypothetical protein [Dysgonomonas macrotermitis]
MKEKQMTISESQLNTIVSLAVDAVLSLSGKPDISAATVHSCMIIKLADEISEGAICSKDILTGLQDCVKKKGEEAILTIMDDAFKNITKPENHGR